MTTPVLDFSGCRNICIIGDLHRGQGRDNQWMLEKQNRLLRDWFFPFLRDNDIDLVIQTGDWFDNRRHISHKCMEHTRKYLIEPIQEQGIPWIVPVGNHDIYHRENVHPNSPRELLSHVPEITVVDEPVTAKIGQSHWDFIPWICKSNHDQVKEFIKQSTSEYCVGHFELGGFLYYPGMTSTGENCAFLKDYIQVFSGHYHCISQGANVLFTGTPWTLTMGDADDSRGVWTCDADSAEDHQFHQGPGTWHFKRNFDANQWSEEETEKLRAAGDSIVQFTVLNAVSDDATQSIEGVQSALLGNPLHDVRLKYADSIAGDLDQDSEAAIHDLKARSPMAILESWVRDRVEDRDRQDQMMKILHDLYSEAAVEENG